MGVFLMYEVYVCKKQDPVFMQDPVFCEYEYV